MAGDGQPARLGRLGGGGCKRLGGRAANAMKTAMQKLLQRWRRGGGVEAWSLSMAAVGDGSVTHEAQSGRGPGKGFLADTGCAMRGGRLCATPAN